MRISLKYASHWGLDDAFRELFQNALDEADGGGNARLIVYNKGTHDEFEINSMPRVLNETDWFFGETGKVGAAPRGKFGEGLKLACLVLLREGLAVTVRSGERQFTPVIEEVNGIRTMALNVTSTPFTHYPGVSVVVERVPKVITSIVLSRAPIWKEAIEHRAPASKVYEPTTVPAIFPKDGATGKLFSRGLFVESFWAPDNSFYSYNLPLVSLERDRKNARNSEINTQIVRTLLANPDYITQEFFLTSSREWSAVYDQASGTDLVFFVEKFKQLFGDKAYPVNKESGEGTIVEHFGYIPVELPPRACTALRISFEKLSEMGAKPSNPNLLNASSLAYGIADQVAAALEEYNNKFDGLSYELYEADFSRGIFGSVDFDDSLIEGTIQKVYISRGILNNSKQLTITLVHELAHFFGTDGSVSHREACDHCWWYMIKAESSFKTKEVVAL